MDRVVKKPDLKAPRARLEAGYCPVNIALWRKFKKETGVKCTYQEFSVIIKTGNSVIADIVCEERDGFRLMNDLGTIVMLACNPREGYRFYDFGLLTKEQVLTTHQNLHSNKKINRIVYFTYSVKERFANRKLWQFDATRTFKRKSSKCFRERWEYYKVLNKAEKAIQILKNEKRIAKELEEQEDFLKTYNDLEI